MQTLLKMSDDACMRKKWRLAWAVVTWSATTPVSWLTDCTPAGSRPGRAHSRPGLAQLQACLWLSMQVFRENVTANPAWLTIGEF